MSAVVYAIRHTHSSTVYIGQTVNWAHRKKAHLYGLRSSKHSNKHLQCAFAKYGEDNFDFCVLEYCDVDNLTLLEQSWVDQMRVLGFRVCNFGHTVSKPTRGYRHSEGALQKIRAANTGRVVSDQSRESIRAALTGRRRPPEVGAAVSVALRGLKRPQEFSDKLAAHWEALPLETKQAVAARAKAVHTGRTRPQSTCDKLSEAATHYHASRRANPDLWNTVVAEAVNRYGSFNTRACVWASKQYKKRGGTHHD